jgi:hypothetical protein
VYVLPSTLLLTTTLVALVAVTVSVLVPPLGRVAGAAVIVMVGAGETVTVTEAVTLPPAPTAVIV